MSAPPDPPARPRLRTAEEVHVTFVRQWAMIALAIAGTLPGPILRLLEVTGGPQPDLPPLVESLIFGLGIFSAATLLIWASEVAETEISAGLALVALALIAVLPEYAGALYFAWTAPGNPATP